MIVNSVFGGFHALAWCQILRIQNEDVSRSLLVEDWNFKDWLLKLSCLKTMQSKMARTATPTAFEPLCSFDDEYIDYVSGKFNASESAGLDVLEHSYVFYLSRKWTQRI